jgi:hypothetical protein
MSRDTIKHHKSDPPAVALGKKMLSHGIDNYTDMGATAGSTVSFTEVFTTNAEGEYGFMMRGHCGDSDRSFSKKWRVPYAVMETANFNAMAVALGEKGGVCMEEFYRCMDEEGPDPNLDKTLKGFLNRFMMAMMADETMAPLLGPDTPLYEIAVQAHLGFCATVTTEAVFEVDPVTHAATRVNPRSFKVMLSNCVQHPNKES